MSDGDDWFERKLRELEESEQHGESEESEQHGESEESEQHGESEESEQHGESEEAPEAKSDPETGVEVDPEAAPEPGASEAERSPSGEFDSVSTGNDSDIDASPDAAGSAGMDDRDDPFGGGGGDDPFGGGETDAFGFADFSSSDEESPEFDGEEEVEFDSDIERVSVGIDGLDELILGGVPRTALMSVIGSAGTGKTTFALQFLNDAIENGEAGVYLTLEESRESILSTAEEKGWPFREYADEGRLAVIAIDPIDMANSLASIRNDLPRLVAAFEADRLVLDSVSLLEMMYDHPAKRRSEVFEFTRALKEAGVTTLLTSEASDDNPYTSRYGIVEYLTDAVFVLQYVRSSNYQETRLAVEIQKIRDANHSRETKPYEITNEGISVYRQANIF
ncbi:KaiC domain-containing protein [Halorubrum luteum]